MLDQFFQILTKEQREAIKAVSGDGARWITASVNEYCPNAIRCLDPFHVVEWANAALDSMRVDAWRRARDELNKMIAQAKRKKYERESPEIKEMRIYVDKIKHSKYALGKNEENLTDRQHERLSMIASEDRLIDRAHKLKESLRKIFKLNDPELAEEYLDKWISRAQRCRIPAFVELQRKIKRNRTSILNTIRIGLSNARIEATNNKIKLLIRIAYGFRNIDTLISFVMLFCSHLRTLSHLPHSVLLYLPENYFSSIMSGLPPHHGKPFQDTIASWKLAYYVTLIFKFLCHQGNFCVVMCIP